MILKYNKLFATAIDKINKSFELLVEVGRSVCLSLSTIFQKRTTVEYYLLSFKLVASLKFKLSSYYNTRKERGMLFVYQLTESLRRQGVSLLVDTVYRVTNNRGLVVLNIISSYS